MKRITYRAILIFSLTACASRADAPPQPKIPEGSGMCIHFKEGNENQLDMMSAAGFKYARTDFNWGYLETVAGKYDWRPTDNLTKNLEKRNMHPYFILDYSNKLYEPMVANVSGQQVPAPPTHPESIAAFAKMAAAAATHYKGHEVIWEIWNEPNADRFWPPKANANEFAALVKAAVAAMRQADPNVIIVAPGLAHIQWDYLNPLLATPGICDGLAAISVHTYTTPPEAARGNYLQLQALINKYAKTSIPFIDGESGYTTEKSLISDEQQAEYLVRQEMFNDVMGVPMTIWYDFKNDTPDPRDHESNFGIISYYLQPRLSYFAAKTLHAELEGYKFDRLLKMPDPKDYVAMFKNGAGKIKIAAWTSETSPHPASFKPGVSSTIDTCVDMLGEPQAVDAKDGAININLAPAPIYMSFK